jgi:hypothetical protein
MKAPMQVVPTISQGYQDSRVADSSGAGSKSLMRTLSGNLASGVLRVTVIRHGGASAPDDKYPGKVAPGIEFETQSSVTHHM